MNNNTDLIRSAIMRDMSEAVLTIGLDGTLNFINPAAEQVLGIKADDLLGKNFAKSFFFYEENDLFNQTILDAVYESGKTHRNIVPYFTGAELKHLQVTTSYLKNEGQRVGVIAVLTDITELAELRDAIKAMEKIRALNTQLEMRNQLLSETFGRFLSDEIVRQLLDTPDGLALGGKKRTLTIMMSDLRGFTAISERMEAHGLISMLNHYLGEMTEVIQRHNGTIIEFIGDGIMAIFGAPAMSDCHASDAVAAAVEMQVRMESVNEWNQQFGYPVLEMGIGLNTGEVIVGNIGSEKRTKYGVVGSHVNLCGRIESYTVGGQVLISPETRRQTEERGISLDVADVQDIYPKGVQIPLKISHITGIGAPYSLSCLKEEAAPEPLKQPAEVSFLRITDKHVSDAAEKASFIAASPEGAIMTTESDLSRFDNLQIITGDLKFFCKVTEAGENQYRVRFTSLPPEFQMWYNTLQF